MRKRLRVTITNIKKQTDFITNSNTPLDAAGHGTASAGIIAAIPNNGLGIAPICWNCRIMNLRVLDENVRGTASGFVKAIDYALKKKITISNNSYGAKEGSLGLLQQAIKRAQQAGMVFVAAAGNFASDNDDPTKRVFPASWSSLDNIISVSAVNKAGTLASFSNWGSQSVHLAAPGEGILAPTVGGGYHFVSGTSFATPHVTGLVALIWQLYPALSYRQVIQSILDGARFIPSLKNTSVSQGTMDAVRTLSLVGSTTSKAPPSGDCPAGRTVRNGSCQDIDECSLRPSVCPSSARCINLIGTFDCRCPAGEIWNGVVGSQSACRSLDISNAGLCRNNGGCGINSVCEVVEGRSRQQKCRCYYGYVVHSSGTLCIRPGLELMNPADYRYAIRQ